MLTKSTDLLAWFAVLKICDVYDNIESSNTLSMVTELCTGQDLLSYASSTPCSENKTRSIVIQILVAVNYMHKRGLFHHHLMLENSKSNGLKLFGLSAYFRCKQIDHLTH